MLVLAERNTPYFVGVEQAKDGVVFSRSGSQSNHTVGHVDCPACLIFMNQTAADFAQLSFKEAHAIWIKERTPFLRPKTLHEYKLCIKNLERFFGSARLFLIHPGMIRAYQEERRQKVGASSINHDTTVLCQILKRADLWKNIEENFQPIPMPKWNKPKVMSPEEEDRLFRIASTQPNWSVAYWVTSLSNNTSATGCEIRKLQLRHIHLDAKPPYIEVPQDVKNEYRAARTIPLNERAQIQMWRILARAKNLGAIRPDHYLFPFRVKTNTYDVDKPASQYFIRQAFNGMRAAADLPWLTPHCMRHQVITKMLESGAPEETVRAIAGHVSQQMMRHYSHSRINAKHAVLSAISPDLHRKAKRA
jgi:integrase